MNDFAILVSMIAHMFPTLHPLEVQHVAHSHVMWHENNEIPDIDDRVCKAQIRTMVKGKQLIMYTIKYTIRSVVRQITCYRDVVAFNGYTAMCGYLGEQVTKVELYDNKDMLSYVGK